MVKLSGVEINPDEITDSEWEELLKAREEKSGVWAPKANEEFFYINWNNSICPTFNHEYSGDAELLSVGNYFKTKEAAEKHLTYLKALQVLRADTKGYEYKVGDEYYNGWWDVDEEELDCDRWTSVVNEGLKFNTLEDIRESFKAHEKEWRIVLGVE